MSQKNVELVRSLYTRWDNGDFDFSDWAHPDIEYVMADGPTPGRWVGHTGLAEGWRSWLGAWEGLRTVAEDFVKIDDERVLVTSRLAGRGRTSGVELGEMRSVGANLFHIRGGKVIRLVTYFDREHALEAAGLSE